MLGLMTFEQIYECIHSLYNKPNYFSTTSPKDISQKQSISKENDVIPKTLKKKTQWLTNRTPNIYP